VSDHRHETASFDMALLDATIDRELHSCFHALTHNRLVDGYSDSDGPGVYRPPPPLSTLAWRHLVDTAT